MTSTNQQEYSASFERGMEAAWPIRPAPMVPDRVSAVPGLDHAPRTESRRADPSVRAQLAAAFRKLGVGRQARAAYERAKDFYRSSGHDWTRGLK